MLVEEKTSLRLISMYTHSLASFFSLLDTGSTIEAYRFDRAYLSVYLHLLSELEPLQLAILNRETASHRFVSQYQFLCPELSK